MRIETRVTDILAPAPGIRILFLTPVRDRIPAYCAGQYADLIIGDFDPRPYSIANAPQPPGAAGFQMLEFHIRLTGSGLSDHIATHVGPGDRVDLEMPLGVCHLKPDDRGRDIVVIGGGSGLAQAKALVEAVMEGGHACHLIAATRTRDDAYLHPLFARWSALQDNLVYSPCLSDETVDGFFPGTPSDLIARWEPEDIAPDSVFYLAGPKAMVQTVAQQLMGKGVAPSSIHSDMEFNPGQGLEKPS